MGSEEGSGSEEREKNEEPRNEEPGTFLVPQEFRSVPEERDQLNCTTFHVKSEITICHCTICHSSRLNHHLSFEPLE